MRTYLPPLLLIAIALGFMLQTACAPFYVAPKAQAPLLRNAGEVHLAAATDIGGEGHDAQIAWSPYEHVGLYGRFSIAPTDSGSPGKETHLRHTHGDIAAGWYSGNAEGTRVELMGGMGLGTTTNLRQRDLPIDTLPHYAGIYSDSDLYAERGTYLQYFIQGDWGSTLNVTGDVITFAESGFAIRAGWLRFIHLNDANGNDLPQSIFFLEPAAFIRGGSRLIQLEGEAGASGLLGAGPFMNVGIYLRVGVHFMFGRMP
ncbi:MAG: hypothetical protein ABI876_16645 [Bacteroidota bacterium]